THFNRRNRPIRRTWVQTLAGAMERGEWRENGDTLKFAHNGTLLDGQHRLAAIVLSGRPQWMLIARNVPDDAFSTIDRGSRRTAADALALLGEPRSAILAATLNLVWRYRANGRFQSVRQHPTTD